MGLVQATNEELHEELHEELYEEYWMNQKLIKRILQLTEVLVLQHTVADKTL